MPTVMSLDSQRHWMLLVDFGKPISNRTSPKTRREICCLFAQLQNQSIKQCDRLLAAGCLDRRLDILSSQIDPLINDDDALSDLSATEIERLQTLAPTLKKLCSQLASYNIPATLVHGDLHLNNIAVHQGNIIFFDWTDSCIAHPFFDLFLLSRESNHRSCFGWLKVGLTQAARAREQNHYLSQWRHYESQERLLEAWQIAKPLAALHHAVTYQSMRHGLEDKSKPEVASTIPYFLRYIINYGGLKNRRC